MVRKYIYKNHHDVFGSFYIHLIEKCMDQLDKILKENEQNLFDINQTKENLIEYIFSDLHKICFRTLLYEFYNYKEESATDEADYYYNRYFKFCEKVQFHDFIEKKYPVLDAIIQERMRFQMKFFQEILTHFKEDKRDLSRLFQREITKINRISFGNGDSHNGGKNVAIITVDNGYNIAYKPRNLYADDIYEKICSIVCENLIFKIDTLKTFSKENRGWQEFIYWKGENNEIVIQKYYYLLGVCLSLLYSLRTDDIHYENLIISKGIPYILDLETIIANDKAEQVDESLLVNFSKCITESVMGTMILPSHYRFSPFDVDLSVIEMEDQVSEKMMSFVVINAGTDEIRMTKMNSNVDKNQVRVCSSEKKINPYSYVHLLKKGFENGYQSIMKNKEKILELFHNPEYKKVMSRQILRPTSIYAKLLDAATHPNYLQSFDKQKALFQKLYVKIKTELDKQRVQEEINALIVYDVPYFSQLLDSNTLVANNQGEIKNYFRQTPIKILERQLNKLSSEDLKKQLWCIDVSMRTLGKRKMTADFILEKPFDRLEFVKKRLEDEYLYAAHYNGGCTIMTHEVQSDNQIRMAPMSYSLYEGSGILLIYLNLYRITEEKRYLDIAESLLKGVMDIYSCESLVALNLHGVFDGIGGYIYIFDLFYTVTGKKYYEDLMLKMTKLILKSELEKVEFDFISGSSGCILLFSELYSKYAQTEYLQAMMQYADHLRNKIKQRAVKLNGFAHGRAGVAAALAKLYEINGLEADRELAKRFVEEENGYYMEDINNWEDLRDDDTKKGDTVYWCHGAPGIGVSRMLILKALKDSDDHDFKAMLKKDLDRAVSKIMTEGFSNKLDYSLCHGKIGNYEILHIINQYLCDKEIERILSDKEQVIIQELQDGKYRSGVINGTAVNNFMLGIYGLDYFMLRLMDSHMPSVLSIELL